MLGYLVVGILLVAFLRYYVFDLGRLFAIAALALLGYALFNWFFLVVGGILAIYLYGRAHGIKYGVDDADRDEAARGPSAEELRADFMSNLK